MYLEHIRFFRFSKIRDASFLASRKHVYLDTFEIIWNLMYMEKFFNFFTLLAEDELKNFLKKVL